MGLYYQARWDEVKRRYANWWNFHQKEGPLVWATATRPVPLENIELPKTVDDPHTLWLDQDYRLKMAEKEFAQTYYAGDAMPIFDTQLLPESLAAFLGSELTVKNQKVVLSQTIHDITKLPELKLNPCGSHWIWTEGTARRARAHFAVRALVAFPDMSDIIDTLAILRGEEELCNDITEHPREVHHALHMLAELFSEVYDELELILRDRDGGTAYCAASVWGPGRVCAIDSSFAAKLSVPQFHEFVVPSIVKISDRLDHLLYHLKGSAALKHLDALLSLRGVNAIAWSPEPGQPPAGDECWYPTYKKILDSGKNLQVLNLPFENAAPLLKQLGTTGVMISTHAPTVDDAVSLVNASMCCP